MESVTGERSVALPRVVSCRLNHDLVRPAATTAGRTHDCWEAGWWSTDDGDLYWGSPSFFCARYYFYFMQNLTEATFQSEVLDNKSDLVLVDFWASWCRPCHMLLPTLEAVAATGKNILKCNVDEVPSMADKYQVSAIPTMIFFKGGEPVKKLTGIQSKDAIEKAFAELA
jgi:thioredoxin 1